MRDDVREDLRTQLLATMAARRELAPNHDEYLVDAFLDRVERAIARKKRSPIRNQPRRRQSPFLTLQLSAAQVACGTFLVVLLAAGLLSVLVGIPFSLGSTAVRNLFDDTHAYQLALLATLLLFWLISFAGSRAGISRKG